MERHGVAAHHEVFNPCAFSNATNSLKSLDSIGMAFKPTAGESAPPRPAAPTAKPNTASGCIGMG